MCDMSISNGHIEGILIAMHNVSRSFSTPISFQNFRTAQKSIVQQIILEIAFIILN